MSKQEQKERQAPRRNEQGEKVEPKDLEKQSQPIEEDLDKLDQMIDEAIEDGRPGTEAESEEEAERRAQEFVNHFKQEGGQ